MVNLGVSGFHRIVTVNKANPVADKKPKSAPKIVPEKESFIIIIQTPIKATTIEMSVDPLRTSPKKIYPKIAAMKGIAANINNVTAAVVIVIEYINPVKAVAKNIHPRIPENPNFKKFL